MKTIHAKICTGLLLVATAYAFAQAESTVQSPAADTVPVTADNFRRAESDMYFGSVVRLAGIGKFHHNRQPMRIDNQSVIRGNRDTLYSSGVFDLDAGPVRPRCRMRATASWQCR
jgi:hypothetical protein